MTVSPTAQALTAWIAGLFPKRTLVLGCYIYLDGEAHVRASVAMDLIVDGVVSRRRPGSTSVAFLGSPATAHLIGQQAYDDATARYADRPWHHAPFGYEQNNRAGGPRSDGLVASTRQSGTTVSRTMTDGFSVFQGPNCELQAADWPLKPSLATAVVSLPSVCVGTVRRC